MNTSRFVNLRPNQSFCCLPEGSFHEETIDAKSSLTTKIWWIAPEINDQFVRTVCSLLSMKIYFTTSKIEK